MRKALVLNDTLRDYHYGCYATSASLAAALEHDGYAVESISVDKIAAITQAPACEADLLSESRYRDFCAGNRMIVDAIAVADIVVINGEGTLHGMRRRSCNLLYLVVVSGHFNGRPTYLVNHSFFPTDYRRQSDPLATSFYGACARVLAGAAARESRSHSVYRQIGVECVQAFDMLPLFARSAGLFRGRDADEDGRVVLGLGVGWQPESARRLARVVRETVPRHRSVTLLNGAPAREPPPEAALPPLMAEVDPRIVVAFAGDQGGRRSVEDEARDWLSAIANASLVVTGRFHHVVAALAFGTPVVGITSNTDKIESSVELLGIDPVVLDPAATGFEAALHAAVGEAMSGRATPMKTDAVQQERIVGYALANRIWPR